MTRSPSTPAGRFPLVLWITCLVLALGFVTWDTVVRSRHALALSDTYGITVRAPAVDPNSPTGYANGVRSVILPDRSMDGYHWIMQAQIAAAEDRWRIRQVDYDNAPEGREVHWASPFRWWLSSIARLVHGFTGGPLGISIERTSLFTGPFMLGLLLLAVSTILARRFSPAVAAVFCLGAISLLPFYVDFVAGYVDHHGFVNACALVCVLALICPRGDPESGRRWVIVSALAGGLGMWISAPTVIPVLIGIGIGGTVLAWLGRRPEGENLWVRNPTLFRTWGAWGAGASLAAYLIEYFPSHMGLRLEINHPLYALAWLGGGETLCRLTRLLRSGPKESRDRDLAVGIAAAATVLLLPVLMLLTKEETFWVADPFLWRLHNDFIAEFQPLARYLGTNGFEWNVIADCLPLLLLTPALWLVFRRKLSGDTKASLILTLAASLTILPLMLNQIRWWSLEFAMLVPLIASTYAAFADNPAPATRQASLWAAACALIFLPGTFSSIANTINHSALLADDIHSLVERDIAQLLRQRVGSGDAVVAASPTLSTEMIYHGGLHGIGTLYWENKNGLKEAAAFYAAYDEAEARRIAQRCGLTHIVVATWDGFEGIYTRLSRGMDSHGPMPKDTFLVKLLTGGVPPAWLREVPFRLPADPVLNDQQVRIYEVTPEQTPPEMLMHMTDYLIDMGKPEQAIQLGRLALDYQDNLGTCMTLARLAALQQDKEAFSAAMSLVVQQLAQADGLELGDQVHLANVLATAGRFDLANTQLQLCLRKATPERLRKLSASTLADFLDMLQAANLAWPDTATRDFAASLLPPSAGK